MGSPRISGNRKPVLTLGTPSVDAAVDLISYRVENEAADSDVVTFEDAAAGGSRQFFLRGEATQSLLAASFWRTIWDNTGKTGVAYTLAPYGNTTPSITQPHFTGTLTYGPKPTLGGDASTSASSAFTFDFEFEIDGVPTIKTA